MGPGGHEIRTLDVVHLPKQLSLLEALMSDDDETGPVAAAVRWQVYRALQQQVRESVVNSRAALSVVDY